MLRRKLFTLSAVLIQLAPALLATPQDEYTKNDFIRVINAFTKQFNLFSNMVIDGKWDLKIADDLVKRFQEVVDHPAWLKRKK